MKSLFHMAYNITDLEETKKFYSEVLGCTQGRITETWVDYNFFGHQISMHLGEPFKVAYTGKSRRAYGSHASLGCGTRTYRLGSVSQEA